jgi:hypothetical protein
LRTFVLVSAEDASEAKAEVAQLLDLDTDEVVAYSGEVFK